jgi:hypothetical protein
VLLKKFQALGILAAVLARPPEVAKVIEDTANSK